MYLSKIRIKDYKSFRDSGEIEFKSGINLIVGQNNAGKTTLLEALEIKIKDIPHRSLKTQKDKASTSKGTNNSRIYISLKLLGNDIPSVNLYTVTIDSFGEDIDLLFVPFPVGYINPEDESPNNVKLEKFIKEFNNAVKKEIIFNFQYSNLNPNHSSFNYGLLNESFTGKNEKLILKWNKDSKKFEYFTLSRVPKEELFGWKEVETFREKIYRFSAERPNLGGCLVGYGKELKSDASNLAEVLQNVQNDNHDVFEEFNKYVSEVFPSVKWVTSVKVENNKVGAGNWNDVRVWSVDKKTRRNDLAFPLSDCGTGVGQVLAILYVVVASEEPRTIIIDEPNSFLHPGAAKKLIQILNKFPQHQYFISTHSPEILTAAKPSTITRLKYVDGETIAESINLEQTKDLRETLYEIGIRFSDVFFAENILWVEGPTEAHAFPLILEKEKELFDVTFLPLVNTGDLREKKQARKNAKLAFEIYNRLSGAHALAPPFVAVVFDKEEENEQEIKELNKISQGKAKFIPRRMYENYLLDSQAIVEVYNNEPNLDEDKKVSVKKVEDWISEKRESKEYLSDKLKTKKGIKDKEWFENVDGARLLEDLFIHLQGNIEYRKTTHSVKLTQWFLENKPEQLSELKDFLIKLVSGENFS